MNLKDLSRAIKQIAEEKGLEQDKIIEAIELSLAAAYKKEYAKKGDIIRSHLDMKTGAVSFTQIKTVVDESTVRISDEEEPTEISPENSSEEVRLPRYNPEKHILLEEAASINPNIKLNEELSFVLEPKEDFGRIAAQTAKQVILQKIRETERESILKEWRGKELSIVSGAIQRFERGNVYIDLGRTAGVMPSNESIPGEHYRPGERLKFLVVSVQEDTRLPGIVLSRSHPKFVSKLFEMEVPELADGICEVKLIAREPGSRTKIAVSSNVPNIDPVGAFVGQRGTRVMAVNNELGMEKIDIISWSEKPEEFIANSLSPAKVGSVEISGSNESRVYVPDGELSLAIGRGGQNVRLAARLTGWKIDVRSQSRPEEVQEGGIASSLGVPGEGDQYDPEPEPEKPREFSDD